MKPPIVKTKMKPTARTSASRGHRALPHRRDPVDTFPPVGTAINGGAPKSWPVASAGHDM
jgi:hypothetical protein